MIFVLSFLLGFQARSASVCEDWFLKTGAKPHMPTCESICTTARVDMATFSCTSDCEQFCRKKESCNVDSYWLALLQAESSPFKKLTGAEKEKVIDALTKFPKNMRPKSLKAIVKASGSDPLARSNPASSTDEFIILFPVAFHSDLAIERILFHEMLHQMMINEWSKFLSEYKKEFKWNENSLPPRSGEFVEPDGRASAEEDFANNIEYYVYEPERLKKKSYIIYSWVDKKLKSQVKREKGCYEKQILKK